MDFLWIFDLNKIQILLINSRCQVYQKNNVLHHRLLSDRTEFVSFSPFFAPVFWCGFTRTTYRSSSHDSTTECTMSMWNMINSHFFDSAVPSSLYNARKRFYIGIRKLNLPATGETWRWKAFRERKRREKSEGLSRAFHTTRNKLSWERQRREEKSKENLTHQKLILMIIWWKTEFSGQMLTITEWLN